MQSPITPRPTDRSLPGRWAPELSAIAYHILIKTRNPRARTDVAALARYAISIPLSRKVSVAALKITLEGWGKVKRGCSEGAGVSVTDSRKDTSRVYSSLQNHLREVSRRPWQISFF